MRKIFGIAAVFALSAALLLAGCSSAKNGNGSKPDSAEENIEINDGSAGNEGSDTKPVQAEPVSMSETEAEVTAEISVDKENYAEGEMVKYTIRVTNNRAHWYTAKTDITYTLKNLKEAAEGSMPTGIGKLKTGESAEINGMVIGSAAKSAHDSNTTGTQMNASVLGTGILRSLTERFGLADIKAEAADYESVVLRPYVRFIYAGEEVMLRAVIELHAYPDKVKISSSKRKAVSYITCHDPSIFLDKDGRYYLFGTHIGAGVSDDLRNWTSLDSSFRASFTAETKEKIRAWSKDENSGSWYGYLWAPDVVYNPVMGKYCYYLSANGDDWKSNIVMLTSDNVTGPYEYAGSIVYGGFTEEDYTETDMVRVLGCDSLPERYIKNGIKNRRWGDKWPNCIDPCVFYDDEGNLWMTYGSWSGGIFMLELDEETGLRDYNVSYSENEHSDPYFGQKIAGGWYVTGEGSFIQKIGDYYWLFVSYGNLEANGGYNIRVFRSKTPNGIYVDELGNTPFYDSYILNVNQDHGVRLFGGYKWRTFEYGQTAQGHNSAFTDSDGKTYIVYHSRTTNGTEGHNVKIHQLFLNKEGWLVAAPYYTDGETLEQNGVNKEDYVGEYEIILHELQVNYKKLEVNMVQFITLNADGTVTGAYEGTWEIEQGSANITISINNDTYSGVVLKQNVEDTSIETEVFTALGRESQITLWGSKVLPE